MLLTTSFNEFSIGSILFNSATKKEDGTCAPDQAGAADGRQRHQVRMSLHGVQGWLFVRFWHGVSTKAYKAFRLVDQEAAAGMHMKDMKETAQVGGDQEHKSRTILFMPGKFL
jgi:hypothetical protein